MGFFSWNAIAGLNTNTKDTYTTEIDCVESKAITFYLLPPSKRQKATDSPKAPTRTLPRDINVKKRADERDTFSCVLTGQRILQDLE